MNVKHVHHELSAYIDGEAKDPGRISRHLQFCEACARHHLELLRLSADLAALSKPAEDPAFSGRVMQRIAREPRPVSRHTLDWRMLLSTAAAAVLLAIGGLLNFRDTAAPSVAGPPQALEPRAPEWSNEENVVAAFTELIEEGVDLSLLPGEEYAENENTDDVSVEEVLAYFASASLEEETSGFSSWNDNVYLQIDSLSPTEEEEFEALVSEYLLTAG